MASSFCACDSSWEEVSVDKLFAEGMGEGTVISVILDDKLDDSRVNGSDVGRLEGIGVG